MVIAIIIYFFISILINYLSQLMGSTEYSIQSGYTGMTDISKKTTFFTYAYNVLLGPISVLLLAILFKLLDLETLMNNIYLLPIVYFAFRTVLIGLVLNRWKLINKLEFFSMHLISIFLSLLLYFGYMRTHINQLLIAPSDLTSELWLIVLIYIAGVIYSLQDKYYNLPKHVDSYIENRFRSIMKRFGDTLKDLNTEEQLILLSIMIYEDYQRPNIFRMVERILHKFRIASSTGIMQIKDSNRCYSDKESIIKMKNILLSLHRDDRTLEYFVNNIYNQTDEYLYSVIDVYTQLQNILSKEDNNSSRINLIVNVTLIDKFSGANAGKLGSISYQLDEDSTFSHLFNYINSEMKLQEKNISIWTLKEETERSIYNAKHGIITNNGSIDWNYTLEDCKIKESLELVGINPRHTEIEILCTRVEEIGDGGSCLFIDEIKYLIDRFVEILEFAIDLYGIAKAVAAFKNFIEKGNDTNKERIVRTIRTKERWKFGFSSQNKYNGQEIVEESIMKYLNYEKDEETKEWVDRSIG